MSDWITSLPTVLSAALVVLEVAVVVAALGIIPGNRRPSTGMAWLILVLAVPLFGLVAFLFFGTTRVERGRRETQARVNATIHEKTAQVAALSEDRPDLAYVASVAALNRHLGALPALGGNTAELYDGYTDSIAAMTEAIETATRFVHVQFYISAWDDVTEPFFAALVRATERGVKVRMLFDHLGSRGIPTYKETPGEAPEDRASSGTRCCRSHPSAARCDAPICATTARSWSWTRWWVSPAPRT